MKVLEILKGDLIQVKECVKFAINPIGIIYQLKMLIILVLLMKDMIRINLTRFVKK